MDICNYENILCKPIMFDKIINFINFDSKINFITSQKFLFYHYLTTIKEYKLEFNENLKEEEFCKILDKINEVYPNLQKLTLDLKNTKEINYDNIKLKEFKYIKKLNIYNIPNNFKLSFLQNESNVEELELNFEDNEYIFNCNELFMNNIKSLKINNCKILNFDCINKLKELKSLNIENIKEIQNENILSNINTIKYLTIRNINKIDCINILKNNLMIEELALDNISKIENFDLIYNLNHLKTVYLYLDFINYDIIKKIENKGIKITIK